ncbi:MAG: hypothetical protein ACO1NO_02125 [Burkholderiaceae bacterium]
MKIKTGLLIAIATVSAQAWSQQAAPLAFLDLEKAYPHSPVERFVLAQASMAGSRDTRPGSERINGMSMPGGDPSPAQSGNSDLSVPPIEIRPLQDLPAKPLSPPAPMTSIAPVTENGITYLCGGVGLDEADYMKREARNYDFMLTFAAQNGSYLANVNVDIADARGQSLLKATCDAPMMLVDMPQNGNYLIRAETAGQTASRTVQVRDGRQGKAMTLIWPMPSSPADKASR